MYSWCYICCRYRWTSRNDRQVSAEFEEFLERNGIKHLTSAPYHPSSNGLAERAVQVVKQGLKKNTHGNMKTRLAQVLFRYRITPQTTTGISPSELLLGRRPRSRLDLLKPHTAERVEKKQLQQKRQHDTKAANREFDVGTTVFVTTITEVGGCPVLFSNRPDPCRSEYA